MSSKISPSADFRRELEKRGGSAGFRCYQCATCSSVCDLAPPNAPFPRRQMLLAQWGLVDELTADPSIWLCHQCNDCIVRCPRDAKPGDVMQSIRSLVVENLASPKFLGKLVGKAGSTWPLLIGIPMAFWIIFIFAVNGFHIPEMNSNGEISWHELVPHWMIYVVNIPVTAFVLIAIIASGKRYWNMMGKGVTRSGTFLGHLVPVIAEILTHKRFDSCEEARPRKTGHLLFFWGFIGAAITTALIVLAMYGWNAPLPVPQMHPFKWIGNISAVLLTVGGLILIFNRLGEGEKMGSTTGYDIFFLAVAATVGFTGALTEIGRLIAQKEMISIALASWLYVVHLGFILCLFITFPYSKFSHMVYRTLAMVHERMTAPK